MSQVRLEPSENPGTAEPRAVAADRERAPSSAGEPFNRRLVLAVVIAGTVVNIVATSIYLPAIPAMANELGTDIRSVQMLLAAYLATSGIGQLFLGPLSDATGRRGLIVVGALCCAVISVGCAAAYSVAVLIVLRIVQGFTGAAFVVCTRAVVRDMNDRAGTARDMAGIFLTISFVSPISQTIGGVLTDQFSWQTTFVAMAVVAGVTFVLAWLFLPETNLARSGTLSVRHYAANYARLLHSREYRAYAAMNIVLFATLYFFYNSFPVILIEKYSLSPSAYGPIAVLCSAGMFIGSVFSNRVALRRGPDWLLAVGISGSALAGIAMLAALWYARLPLPFVVLLPFLWFVGYGVSMPNAIAGAMSVHPAMAGAAAALLGFVQIAAGSLGSAIASVVDGVAGLFIVMAGLSLLNLVLMLIAPRHDHPPGE